jgi:hypothetical protein
MKDITIIDLFIVGLMLLGLHHFLLYVRSAIKEYIKDKYKK